MSVTYTVVLPVRDETVDFLAGLLAAERARRREKTSAIESLTAPAQGVDLTELDETFERLCAAAHDEPLLESVENRTSPEASDERSTRPG
jgi:hypothetical protein